jgi:hypothetical protein
MAYRPLILNKDEETRDGLLKSRDGVEKLSEQQVFRNATEILKIYPLSTQTGGPPYQQVDLSNLSAFKVAVGLKDEEPTGGTWALSADGDDTGMTALSYDISAASLETAINAVLGANAVTVAKTGSLYTITVNATNTAVTFVSATNALTPASNVSISNPEVAAVGVRAIYQITLKQVVYAYTDSFTVDDGNTAHGTISSVNAGTDVITFSEAVVAGNRYRFSSDGALPGGLAEDTDYYALSSGTTSQVSRWPNGSAVDITDSGSGTHSVFNRANGVTLSIASNGSSTSPAVYTIQISPDPLAGSFRFNWQQQQKALVTVGANTAVAAVWLFIATGAGLVTGPSSDSAWSSYYVDVPDTDNNPVRFWFSRTHGRILSVDTGTDVVTFSSTQVDGLRYRFTTTDTLPGGLDVDTDYYTIDSSLNTAKLSLSEGGSAVDISSAGTGTHTVTIGVKPATPAGGALQEVQYAPISNETPTQMFSFLRDAINAYPGGEFSAVLASGGLRVTSGAGGERPDPSSNISVMSSITATTVGTVGRLVGKFFTANDGPETDVCFYITGGTMTTPPDEAANYTRAVAIDLPGGESAADAAAAIAAGVAADAAFAGTAQVGSSNVVAVLNTYAGEMGDTTDASAGYFAVSITQSGFAIVATVDYDTSASTFQGRIEGFNVSKASEDGFLWTLTRTQLGQVSSPPTVEDVGLIFPTGILVELPFSNAALQQKFYSDDVQSFEAIFEIKVAFDGSPEEIWLQTTVQLTTDLITEDTTSGPQFTNVLFGVSDVTAGQATVAVTFSPAFHAAPKLMAFPIIKNDPGDDDPPLVMDVESVTASGGTIRLTGVPTDNAAIPWIARII